VAIPVSASPHAYQHIDDHDDDNAMHTMADGANANVPVWCGIELETAIERFLLCMYEVDSDDSTGMGNEDAGGPVNTEPPAKDQQQWQSGGEVMHVRSDH
jgi:hypothetical protein